jgi:hypothetical protein
MPTVFPGFGRQYTHDLGCMEFSDLLRTVSQLRQDLVRMLTQQRRGNFSISPKISIKRA